MQKQNEDQDSVDVLKPQETPKQRMLRRKQEEAEQRERELKMAATAQI